MQVYQLLLPQSYLLSFYLALQITLKFNSFEQKLNSLQKIHVSFREEFIVLDSSFPEENYNSEEKKSGSRIELWVFSQG